MKLPNVQSQGIACPLFSACYQEKLHAVTIISSKSTYTLLRLSLGAKTKFIVSYQITHHTKTEAEVLYRLSHGSMNFP